MLLCAGGGEHGAAEQPWQNRAEGDRGRRVDLSRIPLLLHNGRDHYNGVSPAGISKRHGRQMPVEVEPAVLAVLRAAGLAPVASSGYGHCFFESLRSVQRPAPALRRAPRGTATSPRRCTSCCNSWSLLVTGA